MIVAIAGFIVTVVFYVLAKRLYRLKKHMLLTPLLVTPIALAVLLIVSGTSFDAYNEGAHWLSDMLQPATIAFAIPLSRHFDLIKKHAVQILVSVFTGSVIAVVSSLTLAKALQLNEQLLNSLLPHSATTPIAIGVSESIGGIPTLTAVAVVATGLFGSIIGPSVIRLLKIRNDIAKGVLLGTSAHGAGTSKAFELSGVSGTVSSISMILAAITTFLITPWILETFHF